MNSPIEVDEKQIEEMRQKFFKVSLEIRKAKEKVIKENGFNWDTWPKFEDEVIETLPKHVDYEGYRGIHNKAAIRQIQGNADIIDYRHWFSWHKLTGKEQP